MPDKKLTYNEIVKALPKVLYGGHGCKNCKYDNGKGNDRCGLKGCKIARYALDLINRLQAENERLEEDSKRLKKVQMQLDDMCKMYQVIKAEAYKEFADKFTYCKDCVNFIGSTLTDSGQCRISNIPTESGGYCNKAEKRKENES